MKQLFNRGARHLVAVFFILLLAAAWAGPCLAEASAAPAAGTRTLRVAFPRAEGFTMIGPDGGHYGLVVDFLKEIAKYTGWNYEYIETDSENLLDDYFSGEFDLMGGAYYAEGFEDYFAYPDYNCGYSKLLLIARRDDDTIKSFDFNTFNGKTIGVFERNQENIRRLKEYLKINNLDCEFKYYSYDELAVTGSLQRCLADGEVDLLLGNYSDLREDFYIAAAFDSQEHYIVTTLDNPEVLAGLNLALERIYDANPNYARERYQENFVENANGYARLNDTEKKYIAEKQAVTVAVPEDWHPMYCLNNIDGHNGLVVDILNEISEYSGLRFSYRLCGSYADAVGMILRGEVDMLGFFVGDDEEAAGQGLALTTPYANLDYILVRNKNSSYPEENLTGAILEGRGLPDSVEAARIVRYPNATSALRDVNRGKLDFFYGMSAHLEYVIQRENFTNIVQVNLINDSQEICFALTSPAQPELLTILNKAINQLGDERRAAIASRNLVSIGEPHMTLTSMIYANPFLALSLLLLFLFLILLAVALAAKSRVRAAEMRVELEKAEAGSRAKSDFLSRMSHEMRTPMNAIVGLTDLTWMMEGLPEKARENLLKLKTSSHYLLNLINDILDMSRVESGRIELASEPFSMGVMLNEIESMMASEASAKKLRFQLEQNLLDDVLTGDSIRLRQIILNLLSNAFKFTREGGSVLLRVTETGSTDQSADFLIQVIDNGPGIAAEDQRRVFASFEQLGSNAAKSQGTGLGLAISDTLTRLMGGELKLKSQLGQGSEFYFSVTLPKGDPAGLAPKAPEPERVDILQGMNLLVAEDNDLNAEIVMELLKTRGASVSRAENGRVALRLFEQSPPGAFQAILMDARMPEMNGLEACRAIRSLPRPDAREIPIIAMTANTFKEDMEACLDAGMTGFVPKPIDVVHLFEELKGALAGAGEN